MKHPSPRQFVDLVGGGVRLVLLADDRAVRVLHWGSAADVDDLDALAATSTGSVTFSSFDAPRILSVLPVSAEGWSGIPALAWHRGGRSNAPAPHLTAVLLRDVPGGGGVDLRFRDDASQVEVVLRLDLDRHGVLAASIGVVSTASADAAPLDLVAARVVLPLPERAAEILDQTGRWTGERIPQRLRVVDGAHARVVRRGRPGHDAPTLTLAGTPGFGFRDGELWGAHVAWSGDHEVHVERLPEGAGVHAAVLVAGELLAPGEVRLAAGESYRSPEVLAAWSADGIDGLSARFHGYARDLPAHPGSPRPLVLNTWEAVYFDHEPGRLLALAEAAAEVGVERFVLDDGWFRGRDHDGRALGDWQVDPRTWPDGLTPLADRVRALGMQFGLWVEPEMVSRDSDLARAHPEWILGGAGAAEWRRQLVLDVAHPEVSAYLLDTLSALVAENGVVFLKWDHNRELHAPVSAATGATRVRAQTLAVYALMDALRERHPGLEIEACASGGARVDLGMLAHAQRVWASDSNDPLERQRIQRWTGVLVPPELVGSHVGPARAETTHRVSSASFRLLTALFGHAGVEWDLTQASPEELEALRRWAGLYRELRPLLHGGITVRADSEDAGELLHGVVAPDGAHAVYAWVRTATSARGSTPRTRLPGLDPARRYRVRVRDEIGEPTTHEVAPPAWLADPPIFSGALLGRVGIPLPFLDPGSGMLVELVAV